MWNIYDQTSIVPTVLNGWHNIRSISNKNKASNKISPFLKTRLSQNIYQNFCQSSMAASFRPASDISDIVDSDLITLDEVRTWTVDALKDYCRKRGFKVSGSKDRQRVFHHVSGIEDYKLL